MAANETMIECGYCGADLRIVPWKEEGFVVDCGGGTGQTITTDPPLNRIGVGGVGVRIKGGELGMVWHSCGSFLEAVI